MPGVIVRTATRSGPTNPPSPESARYFVAGLAERGDTTKEILVRSMAEYEVRLGQRVAYGALYDDLRTFFEEGGSEAYVARVVGADPTTGFLVLKDRAAGTPADTLRIEASSPGAWSTDVGVQVAAGTAAGSYKLLVSYKGVFAEVFDNLVTPTDAVGATEDSIYIRASSLGSATAAPGNQPAILAKTALSAGDDKRGSVVAADVTAALDRFGPGLGPGAVGIPGYPHDLVGAAAIAHCKANRRLALLALDPEALIEDAQIAAASYPLDGEYAGIFYPWVTVPDGQNNTRTISPEGYVAACRARAHREVGPWRPAAGEIAQARYVLAPAIILTKAESDLLDESRVSAIRTVVGTTRVYGWRSLSTDAENYSLLIHRDVLNSLAHQGEKLLETFVFETIDGRGQLLGRVASTLVGMVDPIRQAGGLYERIVNGEMQDPGYSVDVGPSVNTDAVLASNEVHAVLAVRVSPVGQLIDLTIVKSGLTASV
jgi:hypothetical protein